MQSQHRKCLLLQEAQSQDGVWVLADPRDMGLPLPGDMCGHGHWSEGGSKVIAVMNTVALEGRGCSIDPASPVPAALKRALLMPAGLACLSLCLSSSGAAPAAGHCRPRTFASNFANGAGPPVLPPCVQAGLGNLPASPQPREWCPCSTDLQSRLPMQPTGWAALRRLCPSELSPHAPARKSALGWE